MKALARGILALYPLAYRRRYGEEIEALLEDTGVRASTLLDLARAAASAHLRPLPGLESAIPAGERVRSGAARLLACWLLTAIAGLAFCKTTEDHAAAADAHAVLAGAHLAVEAAAALGSLAVLAALVPFAAATLARGRRGDREARGAVALAVASVLALALATGAVVAAARLAPPPSSRVAAAVLTAWALVAVVAGAGCVRSARRGLCAIPIGRAGRRWLAVLGALAAASIAAIATATAVYLVALLADAPSLAAAANGPGGLLSVSASLAIQLAAMALASGLAARTALSLPPAAA